MNFKLHNCLLTLLIVYTILSLSNCRKLSFKESLTAYSKLPNNPIGSITTKLIADSVGDNELRESPTSYEKAVPHEREKLKTPTTSRPFEPTTNSQQQPHLSLWQITKNLVFSLQQKNSKNENISAHYRNSEDGSDGSNGSYSKNSASEKLSQNVTKGSPQTGKNFLARMKNEFGDPEKSYESSRFNSMGERTHVKSDDDSQQQGDEEQQRSKKDVSNSAGGLRDLLWSTGRALWSVNKEHFLPTFLHTKTGGKLSLIRDSIFKPVAILSQFRSGVREINNEKWKSLAHLTSVGKNGWSNPNSQVFVVKYQPDNSPLLTLARYVFRLSKHTVVTKWRLKRALLDLQIRALKKLARIISNKSIRQKLTYIKILSNAVWRGKKAFLRTITGGRQSPDDSPSSSSYKGKDNAWNVDITYSSLNDENHENSGGGYNKVNTWTPAQNTYYPPPQEEFFAPPPPETAASASLYSYYNSMKLRHDEQPSTPYVTPEPLIETPSYATLLKSMGINPDSNKFDDARNKGNNNAVVLQAPAPAPTVVYYSSVPSTEQTGSALPLPLSHSHFQNSVIERPATSYSYHYTNTGPQQQSSPSEFSPFVYYTDNDKSTSLQAPTNDGGTTTPSPFRLKLLKAMSVIS